MLSGLSGLAPWPSPTQPGSHPNWSPQPPWRLQIQMRLARCFHFSMSSAVLSRAWFGPVLMGGGLQWPEKNVFVCSLIGLTCPWPFPLYLSPVSFSAVVQRPSARLLYTLGASYEVGYSHGSGDVFGVQDVAAGEFPGFYLVSFCFMLCSVGHKHDETTVSTLALCSGNVQLGGSPWGCPECASLPEGRTPMAPAVCCG